MSKEIKPERLVGLDVSIDRDVLDALAHAMSLVPDEERDEFFRQPRDGFEVVLLINGKQFPFAEILRRYVRRQESIFEQRARNHAERLVGERRESIELRAARLNRVIDAELDELFPRSRRDDD